ncbi:MAG: hypothetical protein VX617_05250 [Pseudomonadota bacterium]|nr:hypothetical protein [Pseudomonadota bacterium]
MHKELQKVVEYLDSLNWSYEVAAVDMILLSEGSAMIMVTIETCQSRTGNIDLVSIRSPILRDVKQSEELFKTISEVNSSLPFGALVLEEHEGRNSIFGSNKTSLLFLKHALLAQTLDEEEIEFGVGTIAILADELDDQLQDKFGGKKAIE